MPDAATVPVAAPRLSTATDAALVDALSHNNLWWRRTAQRLLLDRRPRQIAPMLETVARKGASPFGRLHALWTLDGLGLLDDELVALALGDTEAGVRENALRLAEPRLAGSALLQAAVLARAVVEKDARARFQLLATLGDLDSAESKAAQEQLFFAHLDDPWMQVAALSAGPDRAAAYLESALASDSVARTRKSDGHAAFFTLAGSAVAAAREPGRVTSLIAAVARGGSTDAWWQAAALEGVRRGMRGADASLLDGSRADLLALAQGPDTGVRRASLGLLGIAKLDEGPDAAAAVTRAIALATDPAVDADRRADAIGLAALGGVASREAQFQAWVDPREPEPVQVAALAALATRAGRGGRPVRPARLADA